MESAILREKQIKGGSRAKKIALIEAFNPRWDDFTKASHMADALHLDCFAPLAMTEEGK